MVVSILRWMLTRGISHHITVEILVVEPKDMKIHKNDHLKHLKKILLTQSFALYPQTRTITISGTYQEIVDGPSSETERSEEDDENLKEIMDFLKKEDIYPFAEVDFSGAGDDGYIHDNLYVDAGLKPLRKTSDVPYLEDYLYNMLGDYGGWVNDEGSFGNFMIDSRAGTITLKFIWNEYAYEDVVFNQEEF